MTVTDEVYVNSPLQGVVFEIRFPGEPGIECHRDEFFEKVRNDFPQVLVPKVTEGTAVALAPYHFTSISGERALLTALNSFAYRTSKYPGYAMFRPEVLSWIRAFTETFKVGRLTRTGLRYTNIIPFAPGVGFPLQRFLRLGMALGTEQVNEFSKFFLATEIPAASGSLTIQVGMAPGEHEGILLDFDFAMTEGLTIEQVEQYMDQSHAETKRLFESLLTDEYRTYLRGDVVK